MIKLDGILTEDDVLMIDSAWKEANVIPEFIIEGDIVEIINRPLSYHIIIIPFYCSGEPYYVNVRLPKYKGMVSEETWKEFRTIKPLNRVRIKCKKYINIYSHRDSIIDIISIESIEPCSKFYYQYCSNCKMIHVLLSEDEMYQCCADPDTKIVRSIRDIIE